MLVVVVVGARGGDGVVDCSHTRAAAAAAAATHI